jgi:tetratricopeptide (TPR) repeat protein
VVGAALLLIIATGIFTGTGTTTIGEKLQNIVNFDFNARERLVFFHDAFKIFAQHPLLGAGGKGWDVLYLNTQSYGYYAENVHNDLLQIAVESGIVGLVPFLSLWAAYFVICFRLSRINSESTHKQTAYLLLGLGTAMFLHSLFDFDLAHGAIAFIMWTLFGLARSYSAPDSLVSSSSSKPKPSPKFPVYVSIIALGILYSLISLSFLVGDIWFSRGEKVLETGDLARTRDDFEKALSYDPWKANTLLSLAQINLAMFQNNGDPTALDNALSYAAKSIAIRPSEPLTHSVYSTALFFKGDIAGSVREAETFARLHPMLESAYEQLAYTELTSGLALAKKGDRAEAGKHFKKTLGVIDIINTRLKTIPPYYMQMWETNPAEPVLSISPLINIYAGTADLCLGNKMQGLKLIQRGLKEDPSSPQVQIWSILALKLEGKENESQALLNQVSAQDPGFVQLYNDIIAQVKW